MPKIDSKKFYTQAIKRYGITPRGLNWNSRISQTLRFDIILELLPKNLSKNTLVDAGCGFGDFFLYLQQNDIAIKRYTGIDEISSMCRIAQEQTNQTIIQANILQEELPLADYYICSGALNVLTKFETFQFIQNCYKHAEYGFVFNILFGEKESDIYNYFTLSDIKTLAASLGVQKMTIQQDYIDNDITVGFFKL